MKIEFYVPDKYGDAMQDCMQNIIDQVLEALKEESKWPQHGDVMCYIQGDGSINTITYNENDIYDNGLIEFGNCFKTEEEAYFKREQLKVLRELEELADDDQIDAYKNYHYMLIYDFDKSAVKINNIFCAGFMYGTHYFKSKESAQLAIDRIGEERLKKYYFCISEEEE